MIQLCWLKGNMVHAFQSRIWNMAPSLLTAWSRISYLTSLNLSSVTFKLGTQTGPSSGRHDGGSAWEFISAKGLECCLCFLHRSHCPYSPSRPSSMSTFPAQSAQQAKVLLKPGKLSFLPARGSSLLSKWPTETRLKTWGKNTQCAGRASAWRQLARLPGFSREIRAAKMFKSPARTPDLIWFYSSRELPCCGFPISQTELASPPRGEGSQSE